MSILQEFKEFAVKGNVVDMAVGIIIGGAFGTIVQSLVKDVLMPPIGMMLGGVDFASMKPPARGEETGHVSATYPEWTCRRLYLRPGRIGFRADLQGDRARQFRPG